MSRGFVKEDDLELAGTDNPERPISPHPNYVTPHGLQQLQQAHQDYLQQREGMLGGKEDPQIAQQLAGIERELRYLQQRLEQAILVPCEDQAPSSVVFGVSVDVCDEQGISHTFHIVGEDEADLTCHKVSYVSPLAKALIGHKVGDEVVWHRPAGNQRLAITAIYFI